MELLSDGCVRVWRGRLGASWRKAFGVFRRFYFEVLSGDAFFAGMSPSELVDWQANATGRDRYRILRLAQDWLNRQSLRYSTKQTRLSYIRSFFLHNLAPLPEDRSFHFQSETPPVEGKLDFEAFRRILHNSNKMYRAVFLMMAQGLMGEKELVYVSNNYWREIIEHLTKNTGLFKLVLPGRKKNRNVKNYYTVLSTKSDWADAYRDYMKSSAHDIFGALFKNERGRPLTEQNIQFYFHWRAVEAGVIKQFTPECPKCHGSTLRVRALYRNGRQRIAYKCKQCGAMNWACEMEANICNVRYGVNPHEIRDLMRSRWQVSGADPVVCEFMMGHLKQIDPNLYNKFMKYEPWYPLQEYQRALPWLNVLSEDPAKVDRTTIDVELESYRTEAEVLRRELSDLKRKLAVLDDPIVLEALRELRRKK
jgi:transposase-like protein